MSIAPKLPVVREPANGIPPVLSTEAELDEVAAKLMASTGPLAVDAERAGSFRYSQGAYLLQLHGKEIGTVLIDPVALPDLSRLAKSARNNLWILHSAQNDLPCLRALKMIPTRLFDTEIAAQILAEDHFSLGALVAKYCGVKLEKKYSMVDWSTRPLPKKWLAYAALDVEYLIPLYEQLQARLQDDGKVGWAEEEFEALRCREVKPPSAKPWLDLRGIGRITTARSLGAVRELWQRRDTLAREQDLAPSKLLSDKVLIQLARQLPTSATQLRRLLPTRSRRWQREWEAALREVQSLPAKRLPRRPHHSGSHPHQRLWKANYPDSFERLEVIRASVAYVAEREKISKDVALAPKMQRELAWQDPPAEVDAVRETLTKAGARGWQVDLVTDQIVAGLRKLAALP